MRRRGELSKSSIDAGWPHQVALPNKQVAAQNTAIRAFCAGLSLCIRGHTFVRDTQYVDVFCFADRYHAQRFEKEFGVEMIAPKDRPHWPSKPSPRRYASDGALGLRNVSAKQLHVGVERLCRAAQTQWCFMADKSSFSADEWSKIVGSPFLAGMAVTLADPSGLWGTLKEGMASASALMAARKDTGAASLIKAIVAELETSEGRTLAREAFKSQLTGKTPAELKSQAIAALTSVGQLVDAKAGTDAPAFKMWLTGIAERVAAASKEGGFLGFGGVAISDAEKATLEEVSGALRA